MTASPCSSYSPLSAARVTRECEKPTLAPLKTIPVQYSGCGRPAREYRGGGRGGAPASRKYWLAHPESNARRTAAKARAGADRIFIAPSSLEQAADLAGVRALENTSLGEERAHQRSRRDVERGVGDRHPLRGPMHAGVAGDFRGSALSYGNRRAIGDRNVDARKRRRDVKRNAVPLRKNGDRVSPDLVRDIAVRRDA